MTFILLYILSPALGGGGWGFDCLTELLQCSGVLPEILVSLMEVPATLKDLEWVATKEKKKIIFTFGQH